MANQAKAVRALLTTLLVTGPSWAPTAAACTCRDNPPCAAVWRAEAVFFGTAADGRFQLRVIAGLTYTVRAFTDSSRDQLVGRTTVAADGVQEGVRVVLSR